MGAWARGAPLRCLTSVAAVTQPSAVSNDPAPDAGRRDYGLKPLLLDAAVAHREGWVTYDVEGVAIDAAGGVGTARCPSSASTS